ncbi:DUF4333 domain-containing protein [Nocardia sp. NPDC050175]|uniref:DUF4333 domain-containing protein n=1 Tax=Nocardia sp. NPDC050175 TaxID=3364317 RepID=UPI003797F1B9
MRRLLLALPLVALTACSVSVGHANVADEDTTATIAGLFKEQAKEDPSKVSCAAQLDWRVGASQKCVVTDRRNVNWPVTAQVSELADDKAKIHVVFDDELVPIETAEENVGQSYEEVAGVKPKSVDCKGLQRSVVDSSRSCELTEVNDGKWDIEFRLTEVSNDSFKYDTSMADFIAPKDIAEELVKYRTAQVGSAPVAASCAGLLHNETGASMRCAFTESSGAKWGATARVSGPEKKVELVIDDKPLR